jgi:hypothetical protein
VKASDIHSYSLFANVDKRNGHIEGHLVILSEEAIEAIELIVLREDRLLLTEDSAYELEGEDVEVKEIL